MKTTTTINGRTFPCTYATIPLAAISQNDEYQVRFDPDLDRRAKEIADSVRDSGATEFRDPIVVFRRGRHYTLLNGAGRCAACRQHLKWTEIKAAIVEGTKQDYWHIAAGANNAQVSERPLTTKDKELACFRLKEQGFSPKEIAEKMALSLKTVPSYIRKGCIRADNLAKRKQLTRTERFTSYQEAKAACLTLFNRLLLSAENKKPKQWQVMQRYIREQYGTQVYCMKADDNEIKKIAFDYCLATHVGRKHRSLVLLYHISDKSDRESQECIEYFRQWYGDTFETVTLTANLERVSRDTILSFLEEGCVRPFASISVEKETE